MRTAQVVSEFLRMRYETRQLVQAGIVEATGLTRGMVSLIISGKKIFPMYHVDEVAAFFGMSVPEFLTYAESELKRSGRWEEVLATNREEQARLHLLRLRANREEDE
jgi:transcriptional regulator with XRE-family HTH domain